jgi:hypothetical protein
MLPEQSPMRFEPIEVESYAGYKSNERPLLFRFRGMEHRVLDVVDRWYEGSADSSLPHVDYFKVKTTDKIIHILCYNKLFDRWSILIS